MEGRGGGRREGGREGRGGREGGMEGKGGMERWCREGVVFYHHPVTSRGLAMHRSIMLTNFKREYGALIKFSDTERGRSEDRTLGLGRVV